MFDREIELDDDFSDDYETQWHILFYIIIKNERLKLN